MLPYAHYIHLLLNQNQLSKEIMRLVIIRMNKLKDQKQCVEEQTSSDVSTVIVASASLTNLGKIEY